jgi:hypothetical protein
MPTYMKDTTTGHVWMVGKAAGPPEGTRFRRGGIEPRDDGTLVVVSEAEGRAADVRKIREMIDTCAYLSRAYAEDHGTDEGIGRLLGEAEGALERAFAVAMRLSEGAEGQPTAADEPRRISLSRILEVIKSMETAAGGSVTRQNAFWKGAIGEFARALRDALGNANPPGESLADQAALGRPGSGPRCVSLPPGAVGNMHLQVSVALDVLVYPDGTVEIKAARFAGGEVCRHQAAEEIGLDRIMDALRAGGEPPEEVPG